MGMHKMMKVIDMVMMRTAGTGSSEIWNIRSNIRSNIRWECGNTATGEATEPQKEAHGANTRAHSTCRYPRLDHVSVLHRGVLGEAAIPAPLKGLVAAVEKWTASRESTFFRALSND